jgi:hypothetical protein
MWNNALRALFHITCSVPGAAKSHQPLLAPAAFTEEVWRSRTKVMKRKRTNSRALVGMGYTPEELKAYYNCYDTYKQKV